MATRHVTVLVSADPAASHRAGEAIRIALGLVAAGSDVALALLGPAAKILDPEAEDYVDGEDVLRHVTTLRKLGRPFYVDRSAIPSRSDWNRAGVTVVPLGLDELAALIARCDRVLAF